MILAGKEGLTHIDCPHCGAPTVVPLQFGDSLLLHPIGFGGMGTVYKAVNLTLNRPEAVKILRGKLALSGEFMDNFRREAEAAASVNHLNVTRVYSFGEREGQCYLVMELLERGSLDDRLTKIGKVPEKEVLNIGIQIAGGLKAAFEAGLLHRDVKPGNILFNEQGIPKIVDFGLARPKESNSQGEPIWGTPYYIAPEKLLGQAEDFRSDIYSLGATLFHAMAGRPPFDAATAVDVAVKHTTMPAYSLKTYLPTVQPTTATVIGRMLAKNPDERYASYDELIADLQRARTVLDALEKTKTIVTASGERISVTSVVATLTALVIVLSAAMLLWFNRAKFFGEVPPFAPPQVVTQTVTKVTAPQSDDVNFDADQPWGKVWQAAADKVAQGRVSEALFDYEQLRRQVRYQPNHLRWALYAEGMALFLNGQPDDARSTLSRAEDPLSPLRVPPRITPNTFITPLVAAALDKLPAHDLEQASTNMPPWANFMSEFSIGISKLRKGKPADAALHFQRTCDITPDVPCKWTGVFKPIASQLFQECGTLTQTLQRVQSHVERNDNNAANQILQQSAARARFPIIRTFLTRAASEIKQRAEQQRRAEEEARAAALIRASEEKNRASEEQARKQEEEQQQREQKEKQEAELQREHGEAEARALADADKILSPLLAGYDFKTANARLVALLPQFKTHDASIQIASRLARIKLLLEFKKQLADSIARQPLPNAPLVTRRNASVTGTLSRATDDELIFTTPYGEIPMKWNDFAPAALIKLAENYIFIFAADHPAVTARRYFALAVFCREYGDRRADTYMIKAIKAQPALQAELEKVFGKPAE